MVSLLNIEHHWYSAVVNRLCCKYRTILKAIFMHVMFIRKMINLSRWSEYLNKNVKSNVFMQEIDSFSIL